MRIDRAEWIDLAAAGAVVVLFALLMYLPGQMQRSALAGELEEGEQRLKQELAQLTHLPQVQRQVTQLSGELESSPYTIPLEEETDRLVRRLSEALRRQGLDAEELTTDPPQDRDGYSTMRLRMEFGCSFASLYGLLERIETERRLLRVDRMDLGTNERDGEAPLTVRLELTAFTARLEEDSP